MDRAVWPVRSSAPLPGAALFNQAGTTAYHASQKSA